MLIIFGAIALGVVIGLSLGGSVTRLADVQFRWWPLAVAGLALQFIPVPGSAGSSQRVLGLGLLFGSYGLLLVFVLANVRYAGFWLVAGGFALNVAVIAINGGMPVNDHALHIAYGSGYAATAHELRASGGAKHHLQRPDDDLIVLTDVIPEGVPVHNVFSAGDMIALVGVALVMAEATRGPRGRHDPGSDRRIAPDEQAAEPDALPERRVGQQVAQEEGSKSSLDSQGAVSGAKSPRKTAR